MKKNLAILFVLIVLAITAYLAYAYSNKEERVLGEIQKQEETSEEATGEGNIHVFNPKPGDSIGLPLKVLGEARVFENQLNIRIKDAGGNIVKEWGVMAEGGDIGEFNLFKSEVNYNKPETSNGTIEVFDYSARDGSEIDKVIIPVKFASVYSSNIKVFFGKNANDSQNENCQNVYPLTRRIPYTQNIAEVAINELLSGLSTDEYQKGYFTSINSGVKLNKITIKNGTAFVDFDSTLEYQVGGSCRVTHIASQITETLEQFPGISDVEISIDGRTDDILQP